MQQYVIETQQLSKKYQQQIALQPTNLKIAKGEIYGLVGRNGAGKSTLLKLLTGQVAATEGEILLFGQGGKATEKERRRLGAIVEQPAFYPNLSGRKNLEYYRRQRGNVDPAVVQAVLEKLQLVEIAERKFKEYSLGNKQRLGLALALMQEPDILILDEPINGLDPLGIIEFRQLLLELNRTKNMTIIISSHLLAELETMITKVGFIEQGELLAEKTKSELEKECQEYIEVVVNNAEKAAAILESVLGLSALEVLTEGKLHIFNGAEQLPAISKALNQHDIDVFKIESHQGSLEDYFTKLVGGRAHV